MDPNSMETYFGLIKTPHDALIIFEACHLGIISRVHRRLSDIERQSVRSGSVYCFDEREAGMRRWTDGKSWSPSRVTGSFLTYRELDDSPNPAATGAAKTVYRPDGLLKQSFSITTSDNKKLHLISYYTNEDVASERLFETPSRDSRFANIVIPKGIYPETSSHAAGLAAPSSGATSDSASATSTHHSSPSPPTPHRSRHRPHHRAFQNNNKDDAEHLRRIDTMAGHRRTHSGSLSVMSRYSPIQTSNDNLHGLGSRSRSNSHNVGGYSAAPYYGPYGSVGPSPEKRYKSSSPSAGSSFPTPPPNAYSPTTSWASEDEQPMIVDTVTPESLVDLRREELMIPPLRDVPHHQNQLPLLATNFDHHHKVAGFGAHRGSGPDSNNEMEPYSPAVSSATTGSSHEQDSLSVLANLATDTMLLPKLEPKEMSSRDRVRWVEDDRQLRALSSMLRL
ncbi:hypothetical protein BGZ89_010311 [Linnemannia elongata]|nr:hypothetical protein BGZ89_010311 [Linnemannia elongata]